MLDYMCSCICVVDYALCMHVDGFVGKCVQWHDLVVVVMHEVMVCEVDMVMH